MRPAISVAAANAVCPESLHTACESCTRTATPVQRSNTAKSAEIVVLIRPSHSYTGMSCCTHHIQIRQTPATVKSEAMAG